MKLCLILPISFIAVEFAGVSVVWNRASFKKLIVSEMLAEKRTKPNTKIYGTNIKGSDYLINT